MKVVVPSDDNVVTTVAGTHDAAVVVQLVLSVHVASTTFEVAVKPELPQVTMH